MSTAFHISRSALFLFSLFHTILNLEQGNKFFHDLNFLFNEKYFTLASSIYKIFLLCRIQKGSVLYDS